MNNDTTPKKICNICGQEFDATTQFFYKNKKGLYGLASRCKRCDNKRTNEWKRKKRANEPRKRTARNFKTPEEAAAFWREYARQYSRQYYRAHKEERDEANRNWVRNHKEIIRFRSREWHRKHPEVGRIYSRNWQKNNPQKVRVNQQRRAARKRNLPDTLTDSQWQFAIEYFSGCAVCGKKKDTSDKTYVIAVDHWIPLSSPDCPGTTVLNVIPLCHARKHGEGGCNNKKNARMPNDWLLQEYDKSTAEQIIERINLYFVFAKSVWGT